MSIGDKLKDIFNRKTSSYQVSKISSPTCVVNNIHVSYDRTTGTFQGLPPEWEDQVKHLFT